MVYGGISMMELDIRIKDSLLKMDFVKRYEELSKKLILLGHHQIIG